MKLKNLFVITAAALSAAPALADINVGVVASLTGPAAALGAETRKAVSLFLASVATRSPSFTSLAVSALIARWISVSSSR